MTIAYCSGYCTSICSTMFKFCSFTPGSKPTFSTNPAHHNRLLSPELLSRMTWLDRTYHVDRFIFTAHRVCIAGTMPWQDVCLSIHLSHAGIESKRLYISSKFFHRRVAPVFPHQTGWQYSDRYPANGASNARGGMKKSRFLTIIRLYLRSDADRAIVTMEGE